MRKIKHFRDFVNEWILPELAEKPATKPTPTIKPTVDPGTRPAPSTPKKPSPIPNKRPSTDPRPLATQEEAINRFMEELKKSPAESLDFLEEYKKSH